MCHLDLQQIFSGCWISKTFVFRPEPSQPNFLPMQIKKGGKEIIVAAECLALSERQQD